jgi:hypothetical protein
MISFLPGLANQVLDFTNTIGYASRESMNTQPSVTDGIIGPTLRSDQAYGVTRAVWLFIKPEHMAVLVIISRREK